MCFRFLHSWARKMTQKERAIGTLQKGSGTISTTHMVLATVCNSSPRKSNAYTVTCVADRHEDKTFVQIK